MKRRKVGFFLLILICSEILVTTAKISIIRPTYRLPREDDKLFRQVLEILKPLSPCRQKIRHEYNARSKAVSPLPYAIIRLFFKMNTSILVDPSVMYQYKYTSKYQVHSCFVHLHFMNKPRMPFERIDPVGISVDHSYAGIVDIFNKHDDIFFSFIQRNPKRSPEFNFPPYRCHFPLNMVVFLVIEKVIPTYHGYSPAVTFLAASLGFRCSPKQCICLEAFDQFMFQTKPDYDQLLEELKRRRSDMRGSPIQRKESLFSNNKQWGQLRSWIRAPIGLAYEYRGVAAAKRLALQIPAIRFNLSIITSYSLSSPQERCAFGSVDSYIALPPQWSLARPYILEETFSLRALYCKDFETPSAYKLTSLKYPALLCRSSRFSSCS